MSLEPLRLSVLLMSPTGFFFLFKCCTKHGAGRFSYSVLKSTTWAATSGNLCAVLAIYWEGSKLSIFIFKAGVLYLTWSAHEWRSFLCCSWIGEGCRASTREGRAICKSPSIKAFDCGPYESAYLFQSITPKVKRDHE